MRSWHGWVLASFALSLGACGSTILRSPTPDGSADAPTVTADAAPDSPVSFDTTAPPDLGDPPIDGGVPVEDLGETPVDAIPGPDAPPAGELPPAGDVPSACPHGITDRCPAAFPGPCASLSDGAPHAVTFTGLTTGLPASCEGAMTGAGPDGIVPLTITTPSDVVLTASPTGGDTVVINLAPAAGCGAAAAELRCANSSAGGSRGMAVVRASTLGPGTYAVGISTIRGNPVIVRAVITPARPRARGDVCPGVVVAPDGPPVSLSSAGFAHEADHGTACGSNGSAGGWVDAVFSYTLTAARDVTLSVNATGNGDVALAVHTACGDRATALPGCVTGNTARRILRNQAPGTYYLVVEHRGAGPGGRTLVATVTTAAPTLPGPADRCPGVALTVGSATRVDVAGLTPGSAALSCYGTARADAVFVFTAPGMSDVLVNVTASEGGRVAYALQTPCGGDTVLGCTGPAGGSLWRRFQGLTPGQAYSLVAGADASAGTLSALYFAVPPATSTMVAGNETCGARRTIPATGGIFRGNSSGAAAVLAAPPCGGIGCAGGRAVYYQLTLAERRRVVANTLGSGFDTLLSVNTGGACPGRPVTNGCNDDTVAQASQVDVMLDPGTYFVVVQGCGFNRGGDYTLDVAVLVP